MKNRKSFIDRIRTHIFTGFPSDIFIHYRLCLTRLRIQEVRLEHLNKDYISLFGEDDLWNLWKSDSAQLVWAILSHRHLSLMTKAESLVSTRMKLTISQRYKPQLLLWKTHIKL